MKSGKFSRVNPFRVLLRTKRRLTLLVIGVLLALFACLLVVLDQPLKVASGFASKEICSVTFVSGLNPDQVYSDMIEPEGAMKYISGLIDYDVNREKHEVTTTIAGLYKTRAAYGEGIGCTLVHSPEDVNLAAAADFKAPAERVKPQADEIAGPGVVKPQNEQLRAALDRAFAEREKPPFKRTQAIVVVKDGKVVAERYAPGVGVNTPLLGYSATKSVTNALIGILVRQGKLNVEQLAPIAAWHNEQDPRHAITIDELLRQTSGLALKETSTGFDPASRMVFIERDMAGFAEKAKLTAAPGSEWAYTDGNYILLSRIIRDAAGGRASDVRQLAQRELFGPVGMKNVTLEFDATGTPNGAMSMLATARDWARFGLLYLHDGMAGSERILPEGWVKYSSSQTLNTGYGAGFWINRAVSGNAPYGLPWGMPHVPRDAFFAMGNMGQHVVIVPSEHLVVVRLGMSHHPDGLIAGTDRLVADVIAALKNGR
ncbi:class C beta-lactamase-related serine hydrolase [Paenibacillus zeisoli]|uniref:Class C beta-lactamase-related serine hydrolase n=1 Tax=Paenibacillus zeisoli TaxID=2496267 RepID=A0A433XHT0_9BACL|nr:serine hydrolase [Paenibacillus zeisoli]RUT33631.1 class C beta-lactamase-related serine hydrolase [Paenibacillus zeisoli]